MELTTTRAQRLSINDDLQTLSQVLYLVAADLPPNLGDLKSFVQLGQSALHRLAATLAGVEEPAADPPVLPKRAAERRKIFGM